MDSGGDNSDRDPPDEVLLRRIRAGDEAAFEALFGRYLKTLQAYARRWLPAKLRRRVSVADVLQETRLVAVRRLLDFEHRGDGSVRNWLLKIVELKVREAVQLHAGAGKRAVDREVTRGDRPDTAQFVGAGPSPSGPCRVYPSTTARCSGSPATSG